VLLADILALIVPQGWFLPVTPGTQLVTLGGAIANDVHGKNHHVAGSFGCHVRAFELLRSDGGRRFCSPMQNLDWFQATVGGLGLTGLITWVEIQLQRIANPWIVAEQRRFAHLDEFLTLDAEYETRYPYIGNLYGRDARAAGVDEISATGTTNVDRTVHAADLAGQPPQCRRFQPAVLPPATPSARINAVSAVLLPTG